MLDIVIFSPIIYIWYEGGRLRPPVVNEYDPYDTTGDCHMAELDPSGGPMAKKAKKAAKKAKKAAKKK
ncbi:MAG: hypothetical protein ABR606_13475 [Vicinamibacterales bacterium]